MNCVIPRIRLSSRSGDHEASAFPRICAWKSCNIQSKNVLTLEFGLSAMRLGFDEI